MPLTLDGNGDIVGLATGALEATAIGSGAVRQVVQATYSTYTTIASTTFTDTGLSASITPTSSSSKVLIIVSQQTGVSRDTNQSAIGFTNILRGSTQIWLGTRNPVISAGTDASTGILTGSQQTIVYLDSPATTSSTTYKTQGKVSTTSNGCIYRVNDYTSVSGETVSTITLMEIAA